MKYKSLIVLAGSIIIGMLVNAILHNTLALSIVLSLLYVSMLVANQYMYVQSDIKSILKENVGRLIVLVIFAYFIRVHGYSLVGMLADPFNIDILYMGVHIAQNILFILPYVLFSFWILNTKRRKIYWRGIGIQLVVILIATVLCDLGTMAVFYEMNQSGNLWESPFESVSSFLQIFSGPSPLMTLVSYLHYAIEITQVYIVAMITWKYAKVQSDRDAERTEESILSSESSETDLEQE